MTTKLTPDDAVWQNRKSFFWGLQVYDSRHKLLGVPRKVMERHPSVELDNRRMRHDGALFNRMVTAGINDLEKFAFKSIRNNIQTGNDLWDAGASPLLMMQNMLVQIHIHYLGNDMRQVTSNLLRVVQRNYATLRTVRVHFVIRSGTAMVDRPCTPRHHFKAYKTCREDKRVRKFIHPDTVRDWKKIVDLMEDRQIILKKHKQTLKGILEDEGLCKNLIRNIFEHTWELTTPTTHCHLSVTKPKLPPGGRDGTELVFVDTKDLSRVFSKKGRCKATCEVMGYGHELTPEQRRAQQMRAVQRAAIRRAPPAPVAPAPPPVAPPVAMPAPMHPPALAPPIYYIVNPSALINPSAPLGSAYPAAAAYAYPGLTAVGAAALDATGLHSLCFDLMCFDMHKPSQKQVTPRAFP